MRYLTARVVRGVVLLVVLVVLLFGVTHVLGDPVGRQLPLEATPEQYEVRERALGLDRPLDEQFADYLAGAVRFDFGDSQSLREPATSVVLDRLPNTLVLVTAGMVLAAVIGVPLGVAMALSRRRWVRGLGNSVSLVALSVPQFWVGILLILVFAVWLGWLPTSGMGSWRYLVLPAATLSLVTSGRLAQMTRSTLVDELGRPYVRAARAKGLASRSVTWHALRNAAVPVTTLFGYETVTALAGYTVLVETVFSWPGVGALLVHAVSRLDLPLTAATAVLVAIMVLVANMLLDLGHRLADPRIGSGTAR